MNEELRSFFEKLRECSIKVIEIVEKEDYDILEEIILERHNIIESISYLNFSKEEINALAKELQIQTLSSKINETIIEKKNKIKADMEEIVSVKRANNDYIKTIYNNTPHIFSKKI